MENCKQTRKILSLFSQTGKQRMSIKSNRACLIKDPTGSGLQSKRVIPGIGKKVYSDTLVGDVDGAFGGLSA